MSFPYGHPDPGFTITRASHIAFDVGDLARSVAFYEEVVGLVVTHRENGTAWLRGVEESAHHSLTLTQTSNEPSCLLLGFRVPAEGDLARLTAHFRERGLSANLVDVPFQGPTLRVRDPLGIPLEFVVSMPAQQRLHDQVQVQKGAAALRYDHVQLLAPDALAASQFYLDMGFKVSDYFVNEEHDETPLGIFMYRKNNPHDLVFLTRPGPVLHHFAYVVQDGGQLFRALDTAGNTGWASALERGPARHGEGHALYVYFRDPDGHRVEILTPPIQMGDSEDEPMRWHRGNRHSWEYPAPKSWLYEGTRFEGAPITGHGTASGLRSLEDVLAARPLKELK
ncbi:MAG: hypothetical protein ABS76_29485 [Pelagibacterium sp. SCN 64-44]|nr:MAG: hypothetical protein ABS76_29485 [Pelagibacterium sp. SCN 64-44]